MKIFAPILASLVFVGCFLRTEPLQVSWKYYKDNFIQTDGRVIDHQRTSVSTSEGQSYAMLRAVLSDDRKTFDLVYKWSEDNLSRKSREEDHLFAWIWGQKADSSWGILDNNPASDADIDIAFSLLLAGEKWGDKSYTEKALPIIKDIYNYQTVDVKSQRILAAGVKQAKEKKISVNSSYFAPYAFRIFAKYDRGHDWNRVVDSSYDLVSRISSMNSSGLVSDWFFVDSETGKVIPADEEKSNYSYDAIRTYARFYIDYLVSEDPRSDRVLKNLNFVINKYKNSTDKKFYTFFKPNGETLNGYEDVGAIAIMLPVISLLDEKTADELLKNKVNTAYNKNGYWYDPHNYYTQNLVWFGLWIKQNADGIKNGRFDL